MNIFNSKIYWENRYKSNGNSGSGSYGILAKYKADIINNFIIQENINDIVEFGCGDGNQLSMIRCNNYTGYDISETVINKCKEKFKDDKSKSFYLYDKDIIENKKYDLVLSLDVIFHIIEDDIFEKYMNDLFNYSKKYVIIYSSNGDINIKLANHLKDRRFTDWVNKNIKDFKIKYFINNDYPFNVNEPEKTSCSNFYIYEKILIN